MSGVKPVQGYDVVEITRAALRREAESLELAQQATARADRLQAQLERVTSALMSDPLQECHAKIASAIAKLEGILESERRIREAQ